MTPVKQSIYPTKTVRHSARKRFTLGNTLLFFLTALLLVTSCKKTQPEPTAPLVADAGLDQPVQVGQLVTLDGTASKDGQGKPLTFQWAITTKPAKSVVALTAPTTARPTFTPDEVGEYEITLTVSNGEGTSIDKVMVMASVAQPVTLNKDITVKTVLEDRILNPNLPDYIVPKDIAVKHELTINPGVVIAFERDVRFTVADGSILVAKGTAEKKIRFIGIGQTKGFWTGIMINSESNVNILEHVEILHAGSRPMIDNKKAGMTMFKDAQIALKNTLFSQNDGYGLYAYSEAILREFSTNTFSNNTEAGILLSTENVAKLDAGSVFTSGNGRNVVEIQEGYIGSHNTKEEVVWGGFADKTPYRLLGSVTARTGWKLNPGVTIEVARDESITINEGGYLVAKGTVNQKVTLTGAGSGAAYWTGILNHSTSTQNSIEYADIRNAGSKVIVSGKRANLALYGDNATISVKNTRISGSGGYGIWVGYGSKINTDAPTSNAFDGNAQNPVELEN
ncbi:hypothetical protein GCM10027347_11720 [Larkinella harenae]